MTDPLPAPLVPHEADLRDFRYLQLDVKRLRDSGLAAEATGDEFRAAWLLICAAWHQAPAASLPDNDVALSQLAGYGRVVKEWLAVRQGALRGWIKADDGRLYNPVLAETANHAWSEKLQHRWKRECERLRKVNEARKKKGLPPLEMPQKPEQFVGRWTDAAPENDTVPMESGGDGANNPKEPMSFPPETAAPPADVRRKERGNAAAADARSAGNVAASGKFPAENALKGEGEGERRKKERESSSSSSTGPRRWGIDDDELRRLVNKAAKGHVAPDCRNVKGLRCLEKEGFDLKLDVLPVIALKVTKLAKPMQKWGPGHNREWWFRDEVAAYRDWRLSAPAGSTSPAIELIFIAVDSPEWPGAQMTWRRKHRRTAGPSPIYTNPNGNGEIGFCFMRDRDLNATVAGEGRAAPAEAAE